MPTYKYKARNEAGDSIEGKIEANDEKNAVSSLQQQKLFVISMEKMREFKSFSFISDFFQRISLKEKIMFTSQMAIMVKSGLPIPEALKTILEQVQNKKMKEALQEIIGDVTAGLAFSRALERHPKIFSTTYIKIIESGEKSGRLDKVLIKLSKDLEKDYDLVGKIRTALMYPAFVFFVLVVIMLIVLIFIMPQLKNLFNEVGVQLPLPTRIIIFLSDVLVNYWWLILILLIVGIILLRRYLSTERGSYAFDALKLKTPILKGVLSNIYMTRFARTLSSLVAAGIPMLDVLTTAKDVMGSAVLKKEVEEAIVKVEAGSNLSKALKGSTYFPPLITQLLSVGEKSGKTDYILKNLSSFLEKEVDNTTKNLTSLLEPILMVVLGIGIAIIIASVLMPIYGLVNVIQ